MSCPFCNKRDCAIYYRTPHQIVRERAARPDGASPEDEPHRPVPSALRRKAVRSEALRPYTYATQMQPPSAAYRAATGQAPYRRGPVAVSGSAASQQQGRFVHYAGPPFAVRQGNTLTVYGSNRQQRVAPPSAGRPTYVVSSSATAPATARARGGLSNFAAGMYRNDYEAYRPPRGAVISTTGRGAVLSSTGRAAAMDPSMYASYAFAQYTP